MVQRWSFWSPEVRANPYPMYAEMRRTSPVSKIEPDGFWAISRFEDAQKILRTPQLFSSQGFRAALEPPWLPRNPLAWSMLVMDPPAHTAMRNVISRSLGLSIISQLEPHIQRCAIELAEELRARETADLIFDFSLPLTSAVIGELLGLDRSLHREFSRWNDDIASITPVAESEERAAAIRKTVEDMERYLREVIARRRRAPARDMISSLMRAELAGAALTDEEILSFLFLLLPAGLHTPVYLLTNALFVLLDRPEVLARVRAQPELLPAFIDEVLRYDPPTHAILRLVTADTEVSGVSISKGELVLVLIGSANRDERQFPHADRFDLERQSQGNLAFGFGAHYCLGASLAKLEVRIALEALLSRFKAFERLPEGIEWIRSLTLRGPTSMPLRLIPA